ncbi:MAG: efflux RND transporter periplasmic adaptor subunit [Bryobacteraceae bacterium]
MPSRCSIVALFPLLAVALQLSGCKSQKAQSASAPPSVPVTVAPVSQEAVPVQIRAVGTVEPSATVQVKSQIGGQLTSVHFVEGANVNKGDLLFEIDRRPYQEALRQAEAAYTRDQALLKQAEANVGRDVAVAKNAEIEAARYDKLFKEGVVARTQYDQVRTNADALQESIRAGRAAIESARASLESDRAAIDRAKLDLTYCEIRAPISGRAGNLLVHAGNLVRANDDNALVVINQVAPIFVSFGIPEEHLAAIRQKSAARKLAVEISPNDDPSKKVNGTLSVIDNTVDSRTGTIRLKATAANQDRVLWPGQFVNTVLILDTRLNALVVPSEAVQPGQRGQFVYVVKPDQTVESRNVTVGMTFGAKTVIEKGLSAGESVVTDGQLRLFPGARIQAVPAGKIDSQPL